MLVLFEVQGNSLSFSGYFTEQTAEIGILTEFLKELQEENSADAIILEDDGGYISNGYIIMEFDPDHLEEGNNKDKNYVTRQCIEFYRKNNYIPKYFNAKNKREITDYHGKRMILCLSQAKKICYIVRITA